MYRLMIVEDNKWERIGLSGFLNWESLGIEVSGCACSGVEGEYLAREKRPHIILTDIVMPGLDGIQMSMNIRKFLPDSKIIILSGYDTFNYAKQSFRFNAFAYLLKPVVRESLNETIIKALKEIKKEEKQIERVENLEKQLDDYLQQNNSHIMLDFLESKIELNSMFNYIKTSGINPNSKKAVVIYSFLSKEDLKDGYEKFYRAEQAQWKDIINYSESKKDILTIINESQNEVVQCVAEDRNITPEANVKEYLSKFQALSNKEIIAGVGETVDVFINLPKSYAQAREAIGFSCFAENGEVLYYRDLNINKIDYGNSASQLLLQTRIIVDELMHNIYKGEIEYGILIIERFLLSLKSRKFLSKIILNSLIIELNRAFGQVLTEGNYRNRQKMDEAYLFVASKLKSYSQTSQYIVNLIRKYTDSRIEDSYHEEIVRKVLVIIEKKYSQNLDLKQISDEIYLSPYYIGSIFKRFTGKKFTQYLNEFRLRKAKELLHESDLKINETAFSVGLNNPSYFTELFRQMYGLSPAAYRDLIRGIPHSV